MTAATAATAAAILPPVVLSSIGSVTANGAPHVSGARESEPFVQPRATGSATREQVFARCLVTRGALSYPKQQGDQATVETVNDAVLAFDSALYDRKMSPSSPEFDVTFLQC